MEITNEVSRAINWLDRGAVVHILENYGFACYDSESDDQLRDALRENIADGTIPASALDS